MRGSQELGSINNIGSSSSAVASQDYLGTSWDQNDPTEEATDSIPSKLYNDKAMDEVDSSVIPALSSRMMSGGSSVIRPATYSMTSPHYGSTSTSSRIRSPTPSTQRATPRISPQMITVPQDMHFVPTEDSTDSQQLHWSNVSVRTSQAQVLGALDKCKKQFSTPFDYLLMFVGWKPVGYGPLDRPNKSQLIANLIVIFFLWFITLFTYTFQAFCCWSKPHASTILTTPHPKLTTVATTSLSTGSLHDFLGSAIGQHPELMAVKPSFAPIQPASHACDHFITTNVIPSCVKLIAYLIGFYHFRLAGNEDVHALMEKVFQSTSTMTSQTNTHKSLITTLRCYLAAGSVYLLVCISCHVLYDIALNPYYVHKTHDNTIKYSLFALDMFGYFVSILVTALIILNYIITCDLLIFHVDSITEKMTLRSLELSVAHKEVIMIKNAINNLNGMVGIMASCIFTVQAMLLITGTIILVHNEEANSEVQAYRLLFVISILPTLIYPMIQAARVRSHCNQLRQTALTMRTFGYPDATASQLDSFILFNMAIRFNVKLFNVPIKTSHIMILLAVFVLSIVVLSILGYFGNTSFL